MPSKFLFESPRRRNAANAVQWLIENQTRAEIRRQEERRERHAQQQKAHAARVARRSQEDQALIIAYRLIQKGASEALALEVAKKLLG